MWMVLGVFVGVMAIVYGLYWLLVVRDEERFLKRLRPTDGSPDGRRLRGFVKTEEKLSSVAPLHAALEKSKFVAPLKLMLEQSAVKLNLGSFLSVECVPGRGGLPAGVLCHADGARGDVVRRRSRDRSRTCTSSARETTAPISSRSSFPRPSTSWPVPFGPDTRSRPGSAWWPTRCRRLSGRSFGFSTTSRISA